MLPLWSRDPRPPTLPAPGSGTRPQSRSGHGTLTPTSGPLVSGRSVGPVPGPSLGGLRSPISGSRVRRLQGVSVMVRVGRGAASSWVSTPTLVGHGGDRGPVGLRLLSTQTSGAFGSRGAVRTLPTAPPGTLLAHRGGPRQTVLPPPPRDRTYTPDAVVVVPLAAPEGDAVPPQGTSVVLVPPAGSRYRVRPGRKVSLWLGGTGL